MTRQHSALIRPNSPTSTKGQRNPPIVQSNWGPQSGYLSANEHTPGVEAMLTLIDEFRRYPTVENARRLQAYFEHNPSRVWVVRSEFLHVLAAAGVAGRVGRS
jgi:hypothetical protein